jgi:hypothetical protein
MALWTYHQKTEKSEQENNSTRVDQGAYKARKESTVHAVEQTRNRREGEEKSRKVKIPRSKRIV